MASKLLIIKTVRPSIDVPFFSQESAVKAAVQAENIPVVVGERGFKNGLVKIRTLLFPSQAAYEQWSASANIATARANKAAYNEAHGHTEHTKEVDMPNFAPLA
jgi:hypothetical protein